MSADNFIIKHWQAELQVFQQNLLSLKEQINPEPVHDLRVAVKKLSSYLKLYSILFNEKNVKDAFAKTKELFSVLGRHRNIEISKQLLLSLTGNNKSVLNSVFIYLQLLQEQVIPYGQQSLLQYEKTGLDELTNQVEQDIQTLDTEETKNKVKDIIISSLENFKHDLKHFEKKSHLIRKSLKDIFYWLKILPEGFVLTKSMIKTIDKILDHLGNIQDHEVVITNLRNYRKTILSNALMEFDMIKKIEASAAKKKDGFSKKAHKMTQELLSKIHKKNKSDKGRLSAPGGS
jgi:CHAD domain-containing protein